MPLDLLSLWRMPESPHTTPPLNDADLVGFAPRLKAFLWDYLLMLGYIVLLVGVSLTVPNVDSLFPGPVQSDLVAFLVLILPVIVYFTVLEGGARQASFGKRKRGLKVVRPDGRPVGMARALIRSCVAFLPWQLGHTAVFHSVQPGLLPSWLVWTLYGVAYGLVLLGALMIWKGQAHRAPWDRVAGTVVVRVGAAGR